MTHDDEADHTPLARRLACCAVVLLAGGALAAVLAAIVLIPRGTSKRMRIAGVWGKATPTFAFTATPRAIAVSPDGTRALVADRDGTVRVFDTGGKELAPLKGHAGEVHGIAFFPDGKRVATASQDEGWRTWDVASGECLSAFERAHKGPIVAIALTPDGKRAVTAPGAVPGELKVWSLDPGQVERTIPVPLGVTSLAVFPDGRRALVGDGDQGVQDFDLATGKAGAWLGPPGRVQDPARLALSPDGSEVLVGTDSGALFRWDLAKGTRKGPPFTFTAARITSVVISPGGKRALVAGWDSGVRLVDLATGAELERLDLSRNFDFPVGLAWLPDGSAFVAVTALGAVLRVEVKEPPAPGR